MDTSTERLPIHLGDEPDVRPRSQTLQARLCDLAESLDWAALLTSLESELMAAIAEGRAQYLPDWRDPMGRAIDG